MAGAIVHANVDAGENVWHVDTTSGLALAAVWPTRAVRIEWQDDGTIEVIPARSRCHNHDIGGTVDLTSLDYYIVTWKGAVAAVEDPALLPITDIGSFDTYTPFVGHTWGILRVLGKWGSAPFWSVPSFPPGTVSGDMPYWDNTTHAWVLLHPPV